ncbi:unnamed protein product, partial [Rodentolepis nana]|uniref:C2H2-type domain-containing protein n=1 Tax=Rodentolepis nana TaxID=102285 RepID=A0A0R3TBT8_RODNA
VHISNAPTSTPPKNPFPIYPLLTSSPTPPRTPPSSPVTLFPTSSSLLLSTSSPTLGSSPTGTLSSLHHVPSFSQLALLTSIDTTLTTTLTISLDTSISISSTSSPTSYPISPASPPPPFPSHPPPTFCSSSSSLTPTSLPKPTFRCSNYSLSIHRTNHHSHNQILPISTKIRLPHSTELPPRPPSPPTPLPAPMCHSILLYKTNNHSTYAHYHNSPTPPPPTPSSSASSHSSPPPPTSPNTQHSSIPTRQHPHSPPTPPPHPPHSHLSPPSFTHFLLPHPRGKTPIHSREEQLDCPNDTKSIPTDSTCTTDGKRLVCEVRDGKFTASSNLIDHKKHKIALPSPPPPPHTPPPSSPLPPPTLPLASATTTTITTDICSPQTSRSNLELPHPTTYLFVPFHVTFTSNGVAFMPPPLSASAPIKSSFCPSLSIGLSRHIPSSIHFAPNSPTPPPLPPSPPSTSPLPPPPFSSPPTHHLPLTDAHVNVEAGSAMRHTSLRSATPCITRATSTLNSPTITITNTNNIAQTTQHSDTSSLSHAAKSNNHSLLHIHLLPSQRQLLEVQFHLFSTATPSSLFSLPSPLLSQFQFPRQNVKEIKNFTYFSSHFIQHISFPSLVSFIFFIFLL